MSVQIFIKENKFVKDTSFENLPEVTSQQKEIWKKEQIELAKQIYFSNTFDWDLEPKSSKRLKYVGGLDISFAKNSQKDACASLVICSYPDMKIVYEVHSMVNLKIPYCAGFLGFREVPAFKDILLRLKKLKPEVYPQLILVDGNGWLHMRNCGSASHIGVELDIPTIGVAKTFLCCDGIYTEDVEEKMKKTDLLKLTGESKYDLAYAMRVPKHDNIVYISPGNRIDLETSLKIVKNCFKDNEIPEPIFLADKLSRDFLKKNYKKL